MPHSFDKDNLCLNVLDLAIIYRAPQIVKYLLSNRRFINLDVNAIHRPGYSSPALHIALFMAVMHWNGTIDGEGGKSVAILERLLKHR